MENYKKIKLIKDKFASYYGMSGYHRISSCSIIPENDKTLLFSNSAILPFKPLLQKEAPRVFNLQKCMRFRGGKDLLDINETPYISTFEMVGCLAPVTMWHDFFYETKDFLLNTLDVSPNNLYVDISSQDRHLINKFSKDFDIKVDRFPQEKYNGNFGMENVMGRCVHFSMLYGDEKTHNFGKIIEIYSNGNVLNYAFGFGIEKYLYMQDNKDNYYESTAIYDVTKDIDSPIAWKYMNTLSAMCHLYSEKIDYNLPVYSKQKKILNSLSYKLSVISELLDITDARLRRDAEIYSRIAYNGQVDVEQLMKKVQLSKEGNALHSKKIQSFKRLIVSKDRSR